MKKDTKYQEFFRSALKKFNVTEPDQLDDKKKKEFFDYVDANWKGKNEKPEVNESLFDMVLDEALSVAARRKKSLQMKKNAPRIARKKKVLAKKMATPEKIQQRAKKQAHDIILKKKVLKNRDKSDLSAAEKAKIETKMKKFTPIVSKLAKKLTPKVKKAEVERLKKVRSKKNED